MWKKNPVFSTKPSPLPTPPQCSADGVLPRTQGCGCIMSCALNTHIVTTQVFKKRRFKGYFQNSYLLLVVLFIFHTWCHSSLGFGEIKMRLHWKRRMTEYAHYGVSLISQCEQRLSQNILLAFLGKQPWPTVHALRAKPFSPLEPWITSLPPDQHPRPSLTANKTMSDTGFSSHLHGFLLRTNYFWIKSAKVLIAAPKGVEEATVQCDIRLILRSASSYLDEINCALGN